MVGELSGASHRTDRTQELAYNDGWGCTVHGLGYATRTAEVLRFVHLGGWYYSHPRPEALGALDKCGRGVHPLIFSTQPARSSKENLRHPFLVHQRYKRAIEDDRETEFIEELIRELGRSAAVYRMITLRTDGEHVVVAQKLENPRPNGQKWDLTLLRPGEDGRLLCQS